MQRKSGILMPIFSLPSKYGIGDFGQSAKNFIDFLSSAGVKVWQVLPLVQTGYGNSPYSSVASMSYSPYYISPDELFNQNLITKEELLFTENEVEYIDYGFLYGVRFPLLRKAYSRFDKNNKEYVEFLARGEYFDYAMFMSIKYASGNADFYYWNKDLKYRDKEKLQAFYNDYKEEVDFWQFTQFLAEKQWFNLKEYANKKGIIILGDLPLYVATDSVDVWKNPKLFKLDEFLMPKKVAGVPPDYFCADGQLWGNPVYNYEEHKLDGYSWWKNRIKNALNKFDLLRIDHFRGLDRYYEIDGNEKTAKNGEWVEVPSKELFDCLHSEIDYRKIIAEDLGIIDDGVRDLLAYTKYPGMKILSFAFDGKWDNLYLPENINENSVCFTGTHDNDTLKGLIDNASEWDYNNLVNGVKRSAELLNIDLRITDKESLFDAIVELGFYSKSKLFILPYQDVIKSDSSKRINTPGIVKNQNWAIRFNESDFTQKTAERIKELNVKYRR